MLPKTTNKQRIKGLNWGSSEALGALTIVWFTTLLAACQTEPAGTGTANGASTANSAGIAQATSEFAITNITLIDAQSGSRANQTVFITGDNIDAVEATSETTRGAGWTIDGSGKFLIPGLWDMHVHITYEPGLTRAMPGLFLSYGITSVRDTGGLLAALLPEIERWRADTAVAPRIFFSGPLLDGATVVYDGKLVPEIGTANGTPAAARENIARLKSAGVDFVKTYELITPQVFTALVEAAREADLPIASHVPLMMRAREAGPLVDSMEHLRNVELDCAAPAEAKTMLAERMKQIENPADEPGIKLRGAIHSEQRPRAFAKFDAQACQQVVDSLRDTVQVPTLRLNTSALYQPWDRPDWQTHVSRLPTASQQKWLDTGKQWAERRPTLDPASGEFSLTLVGMMQKSGVPIGAGTDTPIGSALPGYSLHTELERLVEAGLSELEAIGAATVTPARFLRREEKMGLIKPGQSADLVLLNANPLDDIRNTRRINTVIAKGRVVHTEATEN